MTNVVRDRVIGVLAQSGLSMSGEALQLHLRPPARDEPVSRYHSRHPVLPACEERRHYVVQ